MPHYSYEYTFAPGTTRKDEEELEMPCAWGILRNVDIAFRSGCSRKCHVHIDEVLHQIYPTNPDGDYAFDFYTIHVDDPYELAKDTKKIYLRGWNEGSYPHKIGVAFEVFVPGQMSAAEKASLRIADLLERLILGRRSRG